MRYCDLFAITPRLLQVSKISLTRIRQGLSPAEWARFGGMIATVIGLNVLGWVMLAAALGGHYRIGQTTVFGVGTGALAYTLGMRHAFDADHIAAIDNTTRKLVNEGQRPLSTGARRMESKDSHQCVGR